MWCGGFPFGVGLVSWLGFSNATSQSESLANLDLGSFSINSSAAGCLLCYVRRGAAVSVAFLCWEFAIYIAITINIKSDHLLIRR